MIIVAMQKGEPMADFCNDNRFELIEKYKKKLIEETNIESAPDEMKVLNNILFRFWQMGWLDKLEQIAQPERKKGKWTNESACEFCGFQPWYERDIHTLSFCPNCGADMRKENT